MATPTDFALKVSEALTTRTGTSPKRDVLDKLIEAVFCASLKREEGQPVFLEIVFVDPESPGPKLPLEVDRTQWLFTPLNRPVEVTVRNLAKLSPACDQRTASLGVFPASDGTLYIYGILDQASKSHRYITLEDRNSWRPDGGWSRPGLFQLSAVGAGHLIASGPSLI